MQEAIECFNKNELSQAEKMFEKIKSQTSDPADLYQILIYLFQIYKKTNSNKIQKIEQQLLGSCFENENYKEVINFYNEDKNLIDRVQFGLKLELLKSQFIEGNIEESRKLVDSYAEDIVEEKIYNHAEQFYLYVNDKKLKTLKTMFSKLIFNIEIFNENEIINTTKEIEELLTKNWKVVQSKKKSKVEYIEHLLGILEQIENKTFLIKEKFLNLKLKAITIGSEIKLTKTEKIESVVLNSKNQLNLSFLMSSINDQFTRIDLKEIILELGDIDIKSLGIYSVSLKKYFEKKSHVMVTKFVEEKVKTDFELNGYEEIKHSEIEQIYNYYLEENKNDRDIELEAMSIIKYDNEVNKEPYSLITTFIELELYDAALILALKLEESNSKTYICARVLYFNKQYLESIMLINEKINFNLMSGMESLPYYYLKAESYIGLGKESEAQNLYSLISTFNPNYRSLKERIV